MQSSSVDFAHFPSLLLWCVCSSLCKTFAKSAWPPMYMHNRNWVTLTIRKIHFHTCGARKTKLKAQDLVPSEDQFHISWRKDFLLSPPTYDQKTPKFSLGFHEDINLIWEEFSLRISSNHGYLHKIWHWN
jgi:hypothetical protein